jgi:hypothetical protein
MRHLLSAYPIELLEANPRWKTLVSLHSSLKKVSFIWTMKKRLYFSQAIFVLFSCSHLSILLNMWMPWLRLSGEKEVQILSLMAGWSVFLSLSGIFKLKCRSLIQTKYCIHETFARLMKIVEKILQLDSIMRKFSEGRNQSELAENAKWLELLALRQRLQELVSSGIHEKLFVPLCKT